MKSVKGSALLGTILMITAVTLVYFTTTKILMEQNKASMKEDNRVKAEEMAEMGLREAMARVKTKCTNVGNLDTSCEEYGEKEINTGVIIGPIIKGSTNVDCKDLQADENYIGNTTVNKECPYYLLAIRDSILLKPGKEFELSKQLQLFDNLTLPVRFGSGAKVFVDGQDCPSSGSVACDYSVSTKVAIKFNPSVTNQKKVVTIKNTGPTDDLYIGKGYATLDVIGYGNKSDGTSYVQKQTDLFGIYSGKSFEALTINTHNTTESMFKTYDNLPER